MESIAQRNKIYQALDTHTILVSRTHSLLVCKIFNVFHNIVCNCFVEYNSVCGKVWNTSDNAYFFSTGQMLHAAYTNDMTVDRSVLGSHVCTFRKIL